MKREPVRVVSHLPSTGAASLAAALACVVGCSSVPGDTGDGSPDGSTVASGDGGTQSTDSGSNLGSDAWGDRVSYEDGASGGPGDAGRDASAAMDAADGATLQSCTNEPSGFTPLTNRPFSAITENGWTAPYWLYGSDGGILDIVQDPTAPRSPPNVLRVLYPPGLPGGDTPFGQSVSISGTPSEFYGCMWIKYSAGFVGNGSGVNKILYVWTNDGSNGTPSIYLSAQAVGSGNFQPQIRTQDAIAQDFPPNVSAQKNYVFSREAWVRWEWYMRINTPGSVQGSSADGVFRVWMNGVQTHEYTSVLLSTAPTQRSWSSLQIAPYWGGTGGQVAAAQYLYVDHLVASTF